MRRSYTSVCALTSLKITTDSSEYIYLSECDIWHTWVGSSGSYMCTVAEKGYGNILDRQNLDINLSLKPKSLNNFWNTNEYFYVTMPVIMPQGKTINSNY